MNEILKAGLPPGQARVGEALLDGLTNREIAERLGISEYAVKHQLQVLFLKFNVETPGGGVSGKRIVLAQKLLCA
jgi:DNA-binding NarL/FixJ family response regulator